jgi:hypothetical protein
MPNVCLPKPAVQAFKQALKAGKVKPERLANMSSEERHKFFSDLVGQGDAKTVNSLFESKLLLKNQQRGFLTWAKSVAGVNPEVKRDLISRIEKLDHVLSPAEEKGFLKDLASTKLGIDMTAPEAKQIATMSARLQELESKRRPDGTFLSEDDRLAYGRAKVDMGGYISGLQNSANKLSIGQQAMRPGEAISKFAGLSKSIKASLDNSAIFRQGWKTIWTNPLTWQKNARQSFHDIYKQGFKKEDVMREVNADIVSRPNFDKYTKMKLAIGNVEEEFPSMLPEKIPLLGRAYKASESAYTAFLYRQRADIADHLLHVAEQSGVDITDKAQLQSIGKLINSLTGRGDVGRFEGKAAGTLNNVFFSIRFLKSNVDTLTAHQLQKDVTPFVRKQAAINLVKIVAGSAAILATADALLPGSVEKDPTSTDFGKIRVGDTRFDVTGGQSALVVLAMQLLRQQKKSATTGVVTKFDGSYGAPTGQDQIVNFFTNKFSPAASVVKDIIKQQDFNGNKPTIAGEAKNLFVPLPIATNRDAANDPHAAHPLLVSIADGLGISSSTYGQTKRSTEKLNATQQGFKDKIGDAKFKAANDAYGRQYDAWLADHKAELQTLDDSEKQSIITSAKTKIQNNIYKQYDYTPKSNKKSDAEKKRRTDLLSSIK